MFGVAFTAVSAEARPFAYVAVRVPNPNVSVIDTASNTLVATIPVADGFSLSYVAITPDGSRAYVTSGTNNISVIDTATNTVAATVPAGTSSNGIAITPDGRRAYVTNGAGTNIVLVIDTDSSSATFNSVVHAIDIGDIPLAVAITPDGRRAYVTSGNHNVAVIDTDPSSSTFESLIATILVGDLPFGVAITPDGTRAYVANQSSGTVSVIATATNTVVATVTLSTRPFPYVVAITPNGLRAYVANAGGPSDSTVSVIDTDPLSLTFNSVVATVAMTVPTGALEGVAVTPDGTRVYVTNVGICCFGPPGTVQAIDTASNTVVATVPVAGRVPIGIAITARTSSVDPVPDLLDALKKASQGILDTAALTSKGQVVTSVSADGVAQVIVRIGANFAGEQLTLTLNGDGALRTLGATPSSSSVTVAAVDTNLGPMAFATYLAPSDFVRPGSADDKAGSRQVSIVVRSNSTGTAFAMPLNILRPPVMLVHGIWSNKKDTWSNFNPLQVPASTDGRFFVRFASYSGRINVTSSNPAYLKPDGTIDAKALAHATQAALGFAYNAQSVLEQIKQYVTDFKKTQVAAAIQADVVAHSMGGTIARTIPLTSSQFFTPETFGSGYVHKLITIDTPHLGSPLATQLMSGQNNCTLSIFASLEKFSFVSVVLSNGFTKAGAVWDLQGDGLGGGMSADLADLAVKAVGDVQVV